MQQRDGFTTTRGEIKIAFKYLNEHHNDAQEKIVRYLQVFYCLLCSSATGKLLTVL